MPKRKSDPQIRKPMTPCERGTWIDTEGSITRAGRMRAYVIKVTQSAKERQALEDYCEGALRDGISRCSIEFENPYTLAARMARAEDVAKEIVLTRPYIRTKRKQHQIKQFTRFLATPRRKLQPEIARARQILGLPPVLQEEIRRQTRRRARL